MGDPKTDQELKDIMDEIASLVGKAANYDVGFTYHEFIVLQVCKMLRLFYLSCAESVTSLESAVALLSQLPATSRDTRPP